MLSSYYVLRPIRDEMGVAGGVENLAWLFTATLIGMLLVHPFYTWLVGRLPRRRFVPLIYRFFIANLVIFFVLFSIAGAGASIWIGRAFVIWASIFNLFVVSVFWSLMADLYHPTQSARLFGLVAIGGTLGSILGASITSALSHVLSAASLLLVSAALLEETSDPTEQDVRWAISGNVCRCTGYQNIVKAVQWAAEKKRSDQTAAATG